MNKKAKEKKQKNDDNAFVLVTNFISTFIAAVVVILALFLVALQVFGLNAFNVESSSMSPAYPVNSLVIVKDTAPEEIEIGDTVTYVLNADGVLVTHRVIGIDSENETFTTKGDANGVADPNPVLWGNVVGKVIFHIPYIGKPLSAVTAEENRTEVIIVVVVLGVLSFSWDLIDKKLFGGKKKKDKNDGGADTAGTEPEAETEALKEQPSKTDSEKISVAEIISAKRGDNSQIPISNTDKNNSSGKEGIYEKE